MNTTTVNFRLSCEILRNFVVQNTPLGEIPLFCRSDNRFYRTRTAFTRILLEKVTFFLFIRKIGRFKYKLGDLPRNREPPDQIGRVGTSDNTTIYLPIIPTGTHQQLVPTSDINTYLFFFCVSSLFSPIFLPPPSTKHKVT